MNEPVVEPEAPKPAPILEIAWLRHADLDLAASRRTAAFLRIRRLIAWLGVLATLFAILTQQKFFPNNADAQIVVASTINIFFIATPVLASIFAAFATKFYSNGAWLIYRAGAEEIKKEIYIYRTIQPRDKSRRDNLERRLGEIQRQLFRTLSGEFAFEGYSGPLPSHYNKQDPNSDPGFHDLTGEEYVKYRLKHQLDWHNNRINQRKRDRRWMTIYILAAGGLGALLAALGHAFSLWVAFTASITAALIGWQELRKVDEIIKNYSKVVMELTILYNHWQNLEPEERTPAEFELMVRSCESVLGAQSREYFRSMQEALQEANLEKEAALINQLIKDSQESAERAKETMRENIIGTTQEFLADTEQRVDETAKALLGSLAEEAASEIVQKELDAMSKAITEGAENLIDRVSSFTSSVTSSLTETAQKFAAVKVGKDTPKEQINEILASFPKTNEVKG